MMRRLIAICATLCLLLAAAPAEAARRVAFIVGNDAYLALPKLGKAVNDARAISEAFAKLGFEVTRIENASREAMVRALSDFDRVVGKDDVVAFFFAGHGFEIRGVNYLLPIDTPSVSVGQEERIRDTAFPADRMVERFQARGAKTVLLVLDACRDNPFPNQTRSAVTRGLARMDAPEGVFILFSAGAKQTALDSMGGRDADPNSVFTRVFIRELLRTNRTLVDVARSTRLEVNKLAQSIGHDQVPAYYDQILGDITLAGLGSGRITVETPQIPSAPPADPVVTRVPANPVAPGAPGQTRVAAAPGQATAAPPPPQGVAPLISYSRSNQGWIATIQIPEPALSISYRIGETGDFEETGLMPHIDQRTGKPMPKQFFMLPNDQAAGTIFVQYVDAWGRTAGPFPIAFNPLGALVSGQKDILEQMWTSWIAFRNDKGFEHFLYFTHLVSHRCAIKQAVIDVEGGPSQVLPIPACDEKNPYAIPNGFNPYIRIPTGSKKATVQLIYVDGSKSKVRSFSR
jgi:uncharacterized caspase-like protein